MSFDNGSLPVVGFPIEPLPEFETYDASNRISGVVEVNSQRYFYASYHS
jgi:hypothetical protein